MGRRGVGVGEWVGMGEWGGEGWGGVSRDG